MLSICFALLAIPILVIGRSEKPVNTWECRPNLCRCYFEGKTVLGDILGLNENELDWKRFVAMGLPLSPYVDEEFLQGLHNEMCKAYTLRNAVLKRNCGGEEAVEDPVALRIVRILCHSAQQEQAHSDMFHCIRESKDEMLAQCGQEINEYSSLLSSFKTREGGFKNLEQRPLNESSGFCSAAEAHFICITRVLLEKAEEVSGSCSLLTTNITMKILSEYLQIPGIDQKNSTECKTAMNTIFVTINLFDKYV